jgi:hypothetical protein
LSIEDTASIMTKDDLLKSMIKQGYIVKVKDLVTGEPRYDYHLGPRGKVEVGKQGTLDFIQRVSHCQGCSDKRYLEMTSLKIWRKGLKGV